MSNRLTLAGLAVGAVLAVAGARAASAQYPPPTGSCEFRTSATAAAVGENVAITVTVRDVNGGAVAGQPVALTIADQPGGATLTTSGAATDASGRLTGTLTAGTEAGSVRLLATAQTVSCSAAVAVATGAVAPAVIFPDTGAGDAATGSTFGFAGTVLLELGALAVVSAWAVRRYARR